MTRSSGPAQPLPAATKLDGSAVNLAAASGIRAAYTSNEILVVDDDALVLRAVSAGLTRWGFSVVSSDDPLLALKMVETMPHRFAAVLTDLRMPAISGLELADRIRAVAPSMKILLHSGTLAPGDAVGRVDAAFPKPTSIEEIARCLTTLLLTQPSA
ncbi:MAG: response regulator [Polyangiaceae bacterium]|nr:response regulator [Polyangiaceae bacterium]